MIIGIGCDIIDVRRIEVLINKYSDKFFDRIFTKQEIIQGKSINTINSISHFAKRFSAKEAYAKATNFGIGKNISLKDIEILNDNKGAPFFNKHPFQSQNINAFLSMSDELPYAMSYVILDKI